VSAAERNRERRIAIELFNEVWRLLDQRERSVEENDRMLHAAHASRYHWGEVGSAVNRARGEWQVSRVYSVLERTEPALFHARRCLELCERHSDELDDFDLPYAFEALARAHALAGDGDEARRYARLAREAGERMTEQDERELLLADLETLPLSP
jgi:hypothetical protein